jgi:NifU-like protein involved in Fe-S cluster formation
VSGQDPYSALVARLFAQAPGAGRPDGPGWAVGEAEEPLTGTRVRVYLRASGGRVTACRYQVRGCPHTVAAAALVATQLPGRPVEGLDVEPAALARELDAPAAKLGRIFVIQDAVRSAALQLNAGYP